MDKFIAYQSQIFDDISIKETTEKWQKYELIESESLKDIASKHPLSFYSPGLFTRIGIFIFTWIGYIALTGFVSLILADAFRDVDFEKAFFLYALLHAGILFMGLEMVIKEKHTYKAGIDDAFLYGGLGALFTSIVSVFAMTGGVDMSTAVLLLIALITFPILTFAAIRYVDMLVAALAFINLLTIVFLALSLAGEVGKMLLSFVLMGVSAVVYFYVKKLKENPEARFWVNSLWLIELLSLLVFYVVGNYFVVRSLSEELFNMHLAQGEDIPLAFVFYVFTAVVPIIYVWKGLKHKDRTLLISGLILVVVAVLTFKYYFSLGHPEISLTIAGLVMVLIAYFATRYFKTPKFGVTYTEDKAMERGLLNLESVVIGQTMNTGTQAAHDGFQFGGGKSGGAGADGDF
jgi:uncharacterized membrane protein (DUF485 family)